MSNELGLYEREYYFYSNISQYVPIKCPPNSIIIKDENFDNIGILMDNLFVEDFKINLNLNKENWKYRFLLLKIWHVCTQSFGIKIYKTISKN